MMSALASVRFNVFVEVDLSIVISELFAGLDLPLGLYPDLVRVGIVHGFAIGAAGMINVAGQIGPSRSVDGPFLVQVELIAVRLPVRFRVADLFAGIFDDQIALVPVAQRLEAETGARFEYFEILLRHNSDDTNML